MSDYSYYIPVLGICFGPLADECVRIWNELGIENPQKYDGISMFNGNVRLVIQNFFLDPPTKTEVVDLKG